MERWGTDEERAEAQDPATDPDRLTELAMLGDEISDHVIVWRVWANPSTTETTRELMKDMVAIQLMAAVPPGPLRLPDAD